MGLILVAMMRGRREEARLLGERIREARKNGFRGRKRC